MAEGKFNGITTYHDGSAVTYYENMIPLGSSCIDRVGDYTYIESNVNSMARGCFKDSYNNVYISAGTIIKHYQYIPESNSIKYIGKLQMLLDGKVSDFHMSTTRGRVTFCESSIKPSNIFVCDGVHIYTWTPAKFSSNKFFQPFLVNVMPPPGIPEDCYNSQEIHPDFNSLICGRDRYSTKGEKLAQTGGQYYTASICWYDNRLVTITKYSNTIWLTRTDPMYYWRDANANVRYMDANDSGTGGYDLWCNWYSSTADNSNVEAVCACNGQLILFNDTSIETWNRTGNEDAPIQPATDNIKKIGGFSPIAVGDQFFYIATDDHQVKSIYAGQQKVSNSEVDKYIQDAKFLTTITMRNQRILLVILRDLDAYALCGNAWFKWTAPLGASYHVIETLCSDYALGSNGDIIKFDNDSRYSGGMVLTRAIIDFFQIYDKREIIRSVELICDTGCAAQGDSGYDAIACAISTDFGRTIQIRKYRSLGKKGHNDKSIIWNNLGSGRSCMICLSTSANYKINIYDVIVKN